MFSDVPRSITTIATVAGGIIGLLLSQAFQWSFEITFVVTAAIAIGCVLAAVVVYRTRKEA